MDGGYVQRVDEPTMNIFYMDFSASLETTI